MLVLSVRRSCEDDRPPAQPQQVYEPLQLVVGDPLRVAHLSDICRVR